jgi:hypothetical protein
VTVMISSEIECEGRWQTWFMLLSKLSQKQWWGSWERRGGFGFWLVGPVPSQLSRVMSAKCGARIILCRSSHFCTSEPATRVSCVRNKISHHNTFLSLRDLPPILRSDHHHERNGPKNLPVWRIRTSTDVLNCDNFFSVFIPEVWEN